MCIDDKNFGGLLALHITGGKWHGKSVCASSGRPTSSMVREALCNMLCLENSCGLDLFSGSGIVSFEALSRGAESVILVEKCPKATSVIRANARSLNCQNTIRLFSVNVAIAVQRLKKKGLLFDWIFADPPYSPSSGPFVVEPGLIESMLNILRPQGRLIIEHSSRISLVCDFWSGPKKSKKYGETTLTIFSFPEEDEGALPVP